jgi:hypothetical protein
MQMEKVTSVKIYYTSNIMHGVTSQDSVLFFGIYILYF